MIFNYFFSTYFGRFHKGDSIFKPRAFNHSWISFFIDKTISLRYNVSNAIYKFDVCFKFTNAYSCAITWNKFRFSSHNSFTLSTLRNFI